MFQYFYWFSHLCNYKGCVTSYINLVAKFLKFLKDFAPTLYKLIFFFWFQQFATMPLHAERQKKTFRKWKIIWKAEGTSRNKWQHSCFADWLLMKIIPFFGKMRFSQLTGTKTKSLFLLLPFGKVWVVTRQWLSGNHSHSRDCVVFLQHLIKLLLI